MSNTPSPLSRRGLLAGGAATLGLAACGNGVGNRNGDVIDARVQATRNFLFREYPGIRELAAESEGMLIMPLITEAGFGVGGSFGRGALQIDGVTVDYYSAARATVGFQIGAQQFSHVLFFMTPQALSDFRRSDGWAAGADVRYAVSDTGGSLGIDTTVGSAPIIAIVFGQAGLIAGATLGGVKYTRIIP